MGIGGIIDGLKSWAVDWSSSDFPASGAASALDDSFGMGDGIDTGDSIGTGAASAWATASAPGAASAWASEVMGGRVAIS